MTELVNQNRALKKSQLVGALESICQKLELTKTQREIATSRYEAVGNWLDASQHPALAVAQIYPQGSMGLETTVKPLDQEEFDVDLVCLIPQLTTATSAGAVKALIGNRLRENAHYQGILEEKSRCWRINYANEFHLDITPSIPNPSCQLEGELVPDKEVRKWKPSNPRGYKKWFKDRAALCPDIRLNDARSAEVKCQVESLPGPTVFKGILRRTVQLCKRHRDLWAQRTGDSAPISVILTTLASRSYEFCVSRNSYETEYDVLVDVIGHMPSFVEKRQIDGGVHYFVWNDTTKGENFAEKWNKDQLLAKAFYDWQRAALEEIGGLINYMGMYSVRESLSKSFGKQVVTRAMSSITDEVTASRNSNHLIITSGAGIGSGAASGTRIRPNTFYGM